MCPGEDTPSVRGTLGVKVCSDMPSFRGTVGVKVIVLGGDTPFVRGTLGVKVCPGALCQGYSKG